MDMFKTQEMLDLKLRRKLGKLKQKFQLFSTDTENEFKSRTDEKKIAELLLWVGDDAMNIYNTFT